MKPFIRRVPGPRRAGQPHKSSFYNGPFPMVMMYTLSEQELAESEAGKYFGKIAVEWVGHDTTLPITYRRSRILVKEKKDLSDRKTTCETKPDKYKIHSFSVESPGFKSLKKEFFFLECALAPPVSEYQQHSGAKCYFIGICREL
jgi:hypothetical protein